MKPYVLIAITCLLLLTLASCKQAVNTQSAAPNSPDNSGETTAINPSVETAPALDGGSYDDIFTDINDAAFTTWEPDSTIDDAGNYFRLARIDVVDASGFDHQGIVVVCQGSEDFTKAYYEYVNQLLERYGNDMGVIAGYRNAAVDGERTYRDTAVDFFCMQDVVFTDRDGIERTGVVIALDGSDEYVDKEASLHGNFMDAYL